MAREINHNEEPIEDLDAGVAAEDIRGGGSQSQILYQGTVSGVPGSPESTAVTPVIPAGLQPMYNSLVSAYETCGYPASQAQSMALQEIGL